MADEARLGLASRLLRAGEGEPRDRLGAILILLFGQQATRVARLKAIAVSLDAYGGVHIALGDTPVRLREPVAHLAVTVADDARQAGSPWLFPGENGPMSGDRLRDRLGKANLDSVLMARTQRGHSPPTSRPRAARRQSRPVDQHRRRLGQGSRRHALGLCRTAERPSRPATQMTPTAAQRSRSRIVRNPFCVVRTSRCHRS